MGVVLVIGGEERGMEDVVNSPSCWECQLIRHWGYFFDDGERPVSLRGQLGLLMADFQVGGF